ncbi:alcohol acetyltransferase-domain-containing protein [Astrocystis sublimbata]|nr:alcohol acetyltransferase-domain-containing protein [Astrocystis sublimbata]
MASQDKRNKKESRIIRPFGNLECYEFHMIQMTLLGSTVVNSRYNIPPSLARPEHHERVVACVEDAIARVVIEHPALRLDAVNRDTKRPAWTAVDEIDFTNHVTWEDVSEATEGHDDILRDRIEERLDTPYMKPGCPQWRVLILSVASGHRPFLEIVFDWNHGFGDGTSGKIFHETLLRALNTKDTSTAAGKDVEGAQHTPVLTNRILKVPHSARTLPPPIEKIAKFHLSAKFVLSTAWEELQPARLQSSSLELHAHWAPIRTSPFKTQFRNFDIEAAVLARIVAACRAHATTVTGLLDALVLVSLALRIDVATAAAFTGATALNMRRHLGQPAPGLEAKRTMANYVSSMKHEFGVDLVREIREAAAVREDDDNGETSPLPPTLVNIIWRVATRVRGEIQERLDGGLRDDIVGTMKFVSDWRAQSRKRTTKSRPESFVVTNLGVLDSSFPDVAAAEAKETTDVASGEGHRSSDDSWSIGHAVFATSTEVCGAAFQVSPISVRDGSMCVGCSWQDCVVDKRVGEGIVADLRQWLRFPGNFLGNS